MVKYDSNGEVVWKFSLGGSFSDDISAVEILDNGDLVVGGSFKGTVTFPNDSIYTSFLQMRIIDQMGF